MNDPGSTVKICDLCKISSEETAVFNCNYAKGELNICLGCLTEGIIDIYKDSIKPQKQQINIKPASELAFETFDMPLEVYGFSCEECGNVLFADTFPIMCDCGHIHQEDAIKKQQVQK